MKRLKFKVRAIDIRNGVQGIGNSCAVALGIQRVVADGMINVATDGVYVENMCGYGTDIYAPTKKLKAFIDQFDSCKSKCKPTTFVLERCI